jgi:hypothetical protein
VWLRFSEAIGERLCEQNRVVVVLFREPVDCRTGESAFVQQNETKRKERNITNSIQTTNESTIEIYLAQSSSTPKPHDTANMPM